MSETLSYEFPAPDKDEKPINGLLTQGMAEVALKALMAMWSANVSGSL